MSSQGHKRRRLQEAGLLNPHPEWILDPLFQEHREFFDAHDLLQVRYEMLRAHRCDKKTVVEISNQYGISRQTFYNLLQKFMQEGTCGLLPGKPGPKGSHKLTVRVITFAQGELERYGEISGSELARRIRREFALSIHKRTIEKLLKELRSKKNS